jgi:ubiquinone/menaquinone biosynthesis C-methylase UbiE
MNLRPINEQEILKQNQYNDSQKLAARIRLHRDYGTTGQSIWNWFFDIVLQETPSQADVLEVGTGRGDMWLENVNRIPVGWNITLTDFSAGMLEDNKKHLGDLSKRMTYNIADVQDIPYPDNSFDIVFANMMLYHAPDRAKAIAELHRVLKPDGILFSMTNGENHMKKIYVSARQVDEITTWDSVFKDTFSLQNGEAQLRQQFAEVRVENFDNDLWVTDVQPIIDYIRSMMSIDGEAVVAQYEAEMRAELEQEIAEKGGVLIKKETGTFISRNK